MSNKPAQQYRMLLNMIEQAGHAKFEFKVSKLSAITDQCFMSTRHLQMDSSGPAAAPQWRAIANMRMGA
ncbi:hypothetical protein FRC00_008515 [Tulasnella sp. 408]|nr:hypothetical protein FRC00_008515 [Tulasnella sp. 408]